MPQDHSSTRYSILVAAGTADLRAAITAALAGENHRQIVVLNGQEALDKANAQQFDLVVSGIEMPELDGIELLAKLRKTKPRQAVFIVAEGKSAIDETYLRYAALLGATATFKLPLSPSTFLGAVRAALRAGCRNGAPQEA